MSRDADSFSYLKRILKNEENDLIVIQQSVNV